MGRPRADQVKIPTPTRVLEAAELVFAQGGFAPALLADIAERAGIRRSSLLYHFKTKEELYTATVARAFGRLGEALGTAMSSDEAFEPRLLAIVEGAATFFDTYPAVAKIVARELMDPDGPGATIVLRQVVPLVDMVERFIAREGIDAIRPGLRIRPAVLCLSSDLVLRAAAGPLREPLWGPDAAHVEHCKALMLR